MRQETLKFNKKKFCKLLRAFEILFLNTKLLKMLDKKSIYIRLILQLF